MASRTSRAVFSSPDSSERSVSGQTFTSEHNSDADLAERHAAAVASTSARPMGLLERQDSANYQPRPPAMTERQDSAQNLQAMAEEMAELTATGSLEVEGPVSREDSAHDMAQEAQSQGVQQQMNSQMPEPQGRGVALNDSTLRTDSASESTTGLSSRAGLVRDSAVDGTPGLHAAHGREGSNGRRPAAEGTPSTIDDGDGEGMPSLPALHACQASGIARDSASESNGAGGFSDVRGTTVRATSAFERVPSMRAAGFVRDSASEETSGPLAAAGRRDSASEQLLVPFTETDPSHLREVARSRAMGTAPSLEVARALVLDDPALSLRHTSQQLAWSPRDEPLSRQDSALDSLVAARHAVLADLAQSGRPGTPAETDASFTHSSLQPTANLSAPSSRGDQPILDPLMQARALVQGHFASSSSLPAPLLSSQILDSSHSVSSLEAARLAVLGPSYSGGALRPSSANSGARQRSQELRGGRRWQSFGGGRGESLGASLSQPSPAEKGKAVAQASSSSGVSCPAGLPAVNDQQNSHDRDLFEDVLSHANAMAAGPSSSGHEDYVDFLRRISLEDPRQLSPADAAHHALLISSFRDTLQSSSTAAAAGAAHTQDEVVLPSSSSLQGFGSARTADSGLPDTPMSAAGSSQGSRTASQPWRQEGVRQEISEAGGSRQLSSGYDSAHEH